MSPTINVTPSFPVVDQEVSVEVTYSSSPPASVSVTIKHLGSGATVGSGSGSPPVLVYFTPDRAGDYRVIVTDGTERYTHDFEVTVEAGA